MLKLSSTFGQWMPNPAEAGSQMVRSDGDAALNRGNHARGAQIVRPSRSKTSSCASVHRTSWTRASSIMRLHLCYQKILPLGRHGRA